MIHYIFKFLAVILVIFPFYLLVRRPFQRDLAREAGLGLFILFTLGLLALTLEGDYQSPVLMIRTAKQRLSTGIRINLIPFHSMKSFFIHFHFNTFMVNIVGNIVMFIPWGFGLPLLWKKRQSLFSSVLFSALLPLFIETVQLFIQRSVDVDDLILNFAGGMLGAAGYVLIRKKIPGIDKLAR